MVLLDYLARMDADPQSALELMEPDIEFCLSLPGGQVHGKSRADFAAYLGGRNAVDRVHEVKRLADDGGFESVHGYVVDGGRPTGAFLSAAVISPAGLMARYQSVFTTDFGLVDRSEP
jgi:hypothetical protein